MYSNSLINYNKKYNSIVIYSKKNNTLIIYKKKNNKFNFFYKAYNSALSRVIGFVKKMINLIIFFFYFCFIHYTLYPQFPVFMLDSGSKEMYKAPPSAPFYIVRDPILDKYRSPKFFTNIEHLEPSYRYPEKGDLKKFHRVPRDYYETRWDWLMNNHPDDNKEFRYNLNKEKLLENPDPVILQDYIDVMARNDVRRAQEVWEAVHTIDYYVLKYNEALRMGRSYKGDSYLLWLDEYLAEQTEIYEGRLRQEAVIDYIRLTNESYQNNILNQLNAEKNILIKKIEDEVWLRTHPYEAFLNMQHKQIEENPAYYYYRFLHKDIYIETSKHFLIDILQPKINQIINLYMQPIKGIKENFWLVKDYIEICINLYKYNHTFYFHKIFSQIFFKDFLVDIIGFLGMNTLIIFIIIYTIIYIKKFKKYLQEKNKKIEKIKA